MSPFGIGGSAKGPSKQALERIRANQESLKRVETERASGRGTSPSPSDGSTPANEPGGYLSFIRDCCPTLPFENWFGGGRRPDLEAGSDPKAHARVNTEGYAPLSQEMPLAERIDPRHRITESPERSLLPQASLASPPRGGRAQTMPSDTTSPLADSETTKTPPASGRDRGRQGEVRKRRHSDLPVRAEAPAPAPQRKSSGPVPEGWSLSSARPRRERQLSSAAQRKADSFQEYIRQGYAPPAAAGMLGQGSLLKQLKASDGQYEIRLNQHDRLTFKVDGKTKEVTILEIGGHT